MARRTDSSDNGSTVLQHNLALKQSDAAFLAPIVQNLYAKADDIKENLVPKLKKI